MKRAKKVILGTAIAFAIVGGLYFSGIFDAIPQITIDSLDKIIFTDKRPSTDDENIILCIPAAYSGEEGIIGHYSTGIGRQGKSDFRYTTIYLDCKTHFQQASLVKGKAPKTFSDNKRRYRRALCRKNGEYCIIHSKWPITLSDFANQLIDYERAWNLDMGTYSYLN